MQLKNWKVKIGLAIIVGIAIIVLVVLLITLVFNRCTEPPVLPKALDVFYEYDGNAKVIWSGLTISSTCTINFLLHYTIDDGKVIEISTGFSTYTIENSSICSDIYLQLWTVGESGKLSDESLELNHTVLDPYAYMTDVVMTRTDVGLIGSWRKSEMFESCEASYKVHYSTEFGDFHYTTVNETHMISEDLYCFDVRMEVATVIGFAETSYSYPAFGYAKPIEVNTEISPEDINTLIATWSHSKEELCSVTYNITRSGQEEQWSIVSVPILNLDIVYCRQDSFTITPIAFGGLYIGRAVTTDITRFPDPELLGIVEISSFTQHYDMLTILWLEVPRPFPECRVTYRIDFTSEFLSLTQYSTTPMHIITRSYFCFYLEIEIRPVIASILGEPTRTTYRYDIDPVMNLEITPDVINNTLTATWSTDYWQISCNVGYVVTYEFDAIRYSFITKQRSATFNRFFCGVTTISVKIIYDDLESEERSETYSIDTPSMLYPLQDVEIEVIEERTGVISWDPPEAVNLCNRLYVVNVRNEDLNIEATCSGTAGCNITLDNFCPHIDLTVTQRHVLGVAYQKRYFCDEITN